MVIELNIMTDTTPYGYAQPDALAFLDQPIGELGTYTTVASPPGQDLGTNSGDFSSSAHYSQPPAWLQTPGPEVHLSAGNLACPMYTCHV